MSATPTLERDARYLRAGFDRACSFTVGAKEEFFLVDASSGRLTPESELVLDLFDSDARIAPGAGAAQIAVLSPVCVAVADVQRELGSMRKLLSSSLLPHVLLVAAGAFPGEGGPVTSRDPYQVLAAARPWAAGSIPACGIHIHVAVGGADRALAVYNGLRSYLPEIVALGANAPCHDGFDTGLATMRPFLDPSRSPFGVPPAFDSWVELGAFVRRIRTGQSSPGRARLFWNLGLNVDRATIEVRAADAQTRIEDAAAIVALVQCLVFDLAGRYDAGEQIPVHARARIGEALLLAARDGLEALLPDLVDGSVTPARERATALLGRLLPTAAALGCTSELGHVETMARLGGGSARQREVAAREGIDQLVRQLALETARGAGRSMHRDGSSSISA